MNYNSGYVTQVLLELRPQAEKLFRALVDKDSPELLRSSVDTIEMEVALEAYKAYLDFNSGRD